MSTISEILESCITKGLDYILARQSGDGSWTDWELPPGASSIWTTAYVGYKLTALPRGLRSKAQGRIALAARWLRDRQFPGGGWGYNQIAGPDADSTSFAILLLSSALGQAPERAYEHLLRYQQPDGGFATFLPTFEPNSWNVSHPDITPVALNALLTRPGCYTHPIRRGVAQVLREQSPDGVWNSFWWDSFLYGTNASLSILRKSARGNPLRTNISGIEPRNVFETALLLSVSLNVQPSVTCDEVERWIRRLCAEQQMDGGWLSEPILRVTRRDCFDPWNAVDAGPLFADPNRLYTTVTVVRSLSFAHEAQTHAPARPIRQMSNSPARPDHAFLLDSPRSLSSRQKARRRDFESQRNVNSQASPLMR